MRKLFVMLMLCGVLVAKDPVVKNTGQNCPVEFTDIDYTSWTTPFPTLALSYRNESKNVVMSVAVTIKAYNSVGDMKPFRPDMTLDARVKPGKEKELVFNTFDRSYGLGGFDIIVRKISFDGSPLWVADATHYCKATVRPPQASW